MRIAICEDDAIHAALLERYIEQWVATQNADVMISIYGTAEAFIKDFDDKVVFDLIFLDRQMPGMDGMSLAEYIRQWDMQVIIVFVTNLRDDDGQGYEVGAIRYLRKPVNERKVIEALAVSREIYLKRQTGFYVVSDDHGTIRIPKADILYFQNEGHYILVNALHLGNRPMPKFRGKLKELENEFAAPAYTFSSRGTLINVQHIDHIIHNQVFLTNGEIIVANKPNIPKLNKSFLAIHVEPRLFNFPKDK